MMYIHRGTPKMENIRPNPRVQIIEKYSLTDFCASDPLEKN